MSLSHSLSFALCLCQHFGVKSYTKYHRISSAQLFRRWISYIFSHFHIAILYVLLCGHRQIFFECNSYDVVYQGTCSMEMLCALSFDVDCSHFTILLRFTPFHIQIDRIGDAIVRDDYEEDEDDRVARDIDRERTKRESSIPKIHFRYRSKTTEGPPDPPIDNHQSVMTESVDLNQYESEVSSSQRESVSVPQTVKNELNGFYCPYFMAVRWRLLNFLLSVIATLLAMPYVTNQRVELFIVHFCDYVGC